MSTVPPTRRTPPPPHSTTACRKRHKTCALNPFPSKPALTHSRGVLEQREHHAADVWVLQRHRPQLAHQVCQHRNQRAVQPHHCARLVTHAAAAVGTATSRRQRARAPPPGSCAAGGTSSGACGSAAAAGGSAAGRARPSGIGGAAAGGVAVEEGCGLGRRGGGGGQHLCSRPDLRQAGGDDAQVWPDALAQSLQLGLRRQEVNSVWETKAWLDSRCALRELSFAPYAS